ncbi:MAG TPA: ATP-dependent protease ATPase subunit HslU [Firmicutes bacterium]|jgi:ATP-dependent HslUV protease ATP-binding subunit HslU|nr:ATP-dependent protease ATPase subunit HslU [Bacillota bacterium]
MKRDLTPRAIVAELDRYIVGQGKAKRAVAIALRNRYRRQRVPAEFRDEVMPRNILMIGPTGVGKTEIARRLAKLVDAPFVKVEATKFTEVGYVGRDVETMVRDLVETAVRMVKAEKMAAVADRAAFLTEDRIVDILVPLPRKNQPRNPLEALFGAGVGREQPAGDDESQRRKIEEQRQWVRQRLRNGELEDELIEVEFEDNSPPMLEVFTGQGVEEMGINLRDMFGGMFPGRRRKRRVTVSEAREILKQEEAQKLVDMDSVIAEAVRRAEQDGIIFIDEIDKVAARGGGYGPDVSREGVQRDILPIVEGCTVNTKYGAVKTDHILFIAAGAFHVSKPADLIPELQGRLPIRVELESLGVQEFQRILVEPRNALIKQYEVLLAADGIQVTFTDEAIEEIAHMAARVNSETEDIGARRLHTVLERLLEELSFMAPDLDSQRVEIDKAYVQARLQDIVGDRDLSRYIL